MKLVQSFLTRNPCYTAGRKITVKGLMLHSVGCPQPSAQSFVNSWNSSSFDRACVHGFIDANDGTVYQTLPWNHRGWHAGGAANNTHIGVEMCETSCIKYTSGAAFTCWDREKAIQTAQRTYDVAVELFAMLCKEYGLDPLEDGVIVSHREGYKRGIAGNHGDPEHMWIQLGMGLTMDTFRAAVKEAIGSVTVEEEDGNEGTPIMGKAKATAEQMQEYIKKVNPEVAQSVLDMIPLYLSEGEAEGVRGDIAFAQSCLETGNFAFKGTAVTLDQNNFGAMGVVEATMKGLSFDTPQLGIRCQIQHLKAYACSDPLVNENIDPRFQYVTRGCAPYVEWLGMPENPQGKGWASSANYGAKILNILERFTIGEETESVQGVKPLEGFVKVTYKGGQGLNVRKAPAWGDNVVQRIHGGTYTVVGISEDGAWYKLKSGLFITTDKEYVYFIEDLNAGSHSYTVRVSIPNLNIRRGPGTNYAKSGYFTGRGIFTIVEEAQGEGASRWGLLKSYQRNRNGWISLDYATKI